MHLEGSKVPPEYAQLRYCFVVRCMVSIVIECERNKLRGCIFQLWAPCKLVAPAATVDSEVSRNDIYLPVHRVGHVVFDEEDGEGEDEKEDVAANGYCHANTVSEVI